MKPHIILASASIGRKTLLQKLGVPFSIQVSAVDEDKIVTKDPYKMLALRARAKAEDVATKIIQLSNSQINTNYPIEKNTRRYTLDANKRHAKTIVQALNGQTHDFVTGTTIIHLSSVIPGLTGNLTKKDPRFREDDKFVEINRWENISTTRVTCRQMTESEIERYTSRYNFRKFAAAYALNETPWNWITKIDGSYTNVIGLPFEVVLPIFKDLKLI
ncbi:MAG: maf-like protein [Candidatus Gottesmanbacteria bacterium GW2011_GWA1_42_26]|nr:MAG: maf-like protein [Candidatus Gottesmanbacteria bacterium GW2011_GWA1_42_26]